MKNSVVIAFIGLTVFCGSLVQAQTRYERVDRKGGYERDRINSDEKGRIMIPSRTITTPLATVTPVSQTRLSELQQALNKFKTAESDDDLSLIHI